MRSRPPRTRPPRRGLTLVEMLVSVALLVLMMTVIVTIFAAATGAVSGLQTFQELDSELRQLSITIRQDLEGITAKMTPPQDPNRDLGGYFEYSENAFADLQNEDTDDTLRFTARAPEGQLFTGRAWLGSNPTLTQQPVFITSQYAEIIYFLRNGNLYRRVLLVAPDRQSAINSAWAGTTVANRRGVFQANLFGGATVSWQGMNDLSAHPAPSGSVAARDFPIVLNTLTDLINRENRFASPRFANDFFDLGGNPSPDGIPDDNNINLVTSSVDGDGIKDFYPTLYSQVPQNLRNDPNPLVFENSATVRLLTPDAMAFPYVYPGAYSVPDRIGGSLAGGGWIHSTDPNPPAAPAPATTPLLDQLRVLNHSPLESGDSLPVPGGTQTWWGWPTWRETMSPNWTDPYQLLSTGGVATGSNTAGTPGVQAHGLHPFDASALPAANRAGTAINFLPPMDLNYRAIAQPYNDGAGSALFATGVAPPTDTSFVWRAAWDDDLLMTGVRSFDVKAYDDAYPGYVDLGWGDDLRLYPAASRPPNGTPAFLPGTPPTMAWNGRAYDTLAQTFAHEGRMPPLINDLRLDPQFPNPSYPNPPFAGFTNYTGNVGDDNPTIVRLRRVWDSWSTDYTRVPSGGLNASTKLPQGPPLAPPVYPSYPPPYPAPLRGIQIQIRVVDPRGERVKTLTIRQDFTEKL